MTRRGSQDGESRRRSISVINTALPVGAGDEIFRTLSRTFSGKSRQEFDDREASESEDSADSDSAKTKVEDWRLAGDVKAFQLNDPAEGRKLGVTWDNLSVEVVPTDALLQENFLSQFNIPQQVKESRQKPGLRTILDSSRGHVKPGEMLLVLGR